MERFTLPYRYRYGDILTPRSLRLQPSGLSSLASLRLSSALEIERSVLTNRLREVDLDIQVESKRQLYSSLLSTPFASRATVPPIPSGSSIEFDPASLFLQSLEAGGGQVAAPKQGPGFVFKNTVPGQVSTPHSQEESSRPSQAWDTMFKRLVAYRIRRGHCLPKEKDDPKLGRWVRNQRNRKKQGRLDQARIELLNSIGFVWCVIHHESWDIMYNRLKKYKEEHGDCLCPRSYKKDPKLGRWVDTQRNKDKDDMSEERLKKLNDIGFVWHVHQKSWDDMFLRLVKYKEVKGDCLVPCIYPADPKLGTWVHVQRSRKRMLPEERKARLNDIGFVWSIFEQQTAKKQDGL